MSSTAAPKHLDAAALAGIASGKSPSETDAAHLARCAACRRALAALDPSALFSLLNVLPPSQPAPPPPRFASMQLPTVASVPQANSHVARRRATWAIAVALILGIAGIYAVRNSTQPVTTGSPHLIARRAAAPSLAVVERVYSESARVITVVPPDDEGPSFTVILDAGIDL